VLDKKGNNKDYSSLIRNKKDEPIINDYSRLYNNNPPI
jgi:hypothetical protein